jgi:iron complex transport system ATP-binding protein
MAAAHIEAQHLGYRVGDSWLVKGVDLHLAAAKVWAIVGPNGAGKSSLLNLLSGQTQPNAGSAQLNGRALTVWKAHELARCRAVMPQSTQVAFNFRVQDIVELGRYPHRLRPSSNEGEIVSKALALTQVSHLAGRQMHTLSGGEQARVQLARALAQIWEPQPELGARWLLLDEPTAALDIAHQQAVMRTVRQWSRESGHISPPAQVHPKRLDNRLSKNDSIGVVTVLHDLNLALRYADQVLVMHQGQLVACGACEQILTPELIAQVWEVQARVENDPRGHKVVLY